jgi:hypothetical protein
MKTNAPAARVAVVVPRLLPQRKALAFAILCLGCFIAFLDIQIVSASIEEIGGGLSASPDDMSWVQTSYPIGEIIVIPLAAWLSRVSSTRWLVTIGAAWTPPLNSFKASPSLTWCGNASPIGLLRRQELVSVTPLACWKPRSADWTSRAGAAPTVVPALHEEWRDRKPGPARGSRV